MIENGAIIFTSPEFRTIEDEISVLLSDLISYPN
jgi:hypothetical protein